jgi:hypothetical protein
MANFVMALYAFLLLVPAIAAQSISSSNSALPKQVDQLLMKYTNRGMSNSVLVAPLTVQMGIGATQPELDVCAHTFPA